MRYYIQAYIPIVEPDEDTTTYDSIPDALADLVELEAMQPENKYEILELPLSTDKQPVSIDEGGLPKS
ncbi:MAG: hypothetical protein KKF27_21475 [Gammaproteobacteria bacterium]|nr:hypothetical protein [Gammaproteobacteria bacterium]